MEKVSSKIGKEREIIPRGKTNYGKEVLELLQVKEGEGFVDVGCGVGLQTTMAGKLNGAEAIGIEFDLGTIKFAEFIAKITELSFQDRKIGKEIGNIIAEIEKLVASKKGKKFENSKFYDLANKMEKGEFSVQEMGKLQGDLLDWMAGKNLYNIIYRKLKSVDPGLEGKISQIKLPKNVKFIHGDAAHLPIKSDYADKILCLDMLHWMPSNDRPKAIAELFRIAKNGARLKISWERMEGLGEKSEEIIKEIDEIKRQIERIAKEKNVNLKSEKSGVFTISKSENE